MSKQYIITEVRLTNGTHAVRRPFSHTTTDLEAVKQRIRRFTRKEVDLTYKTI